MVTKGMKCFLSYVPNYTVLTLSIFVEYFLQTSFFIYDFLPLQGRNPQTETIEWFIEDQAFSLSYNLAPLPPPPLSCKVKHMNRQLVDGTGDGGKVGGGEPNHTMARAWSSIKHSIFFACKSLKGGGGGDIRLWSRPERSKSYVAPFTPSPARLARYSYLYSNQSPISPSLWSRHSYEILLSRESMYLCVVYKCCFLGKTICRTLPYCTGLKNTYQSLLSLFKWFDLIVTYVGLQEL